MKAFILLVVVAVAKATTVQLAPVAVAETGASAQFRSEDNLGNYNFGYNEDHTSGGSFRREAGDAYGNVAGSYGLRDADGRIRIVNYIANDDGFKADIKTNEPGVEPKDTADATFNKAESVVVQSAVAVPAPAPIVAIPAVQPVAYKTEQVAVAAPLFPAAAPVPVAKTIAQPVAIKTEQVAFSSPAFPVASAIPVAKTIAQPVAIKTEQVAISAPIAAATTYAFPEPAIVPVAKTHSTVISTAETKPISYAFPPVAPVPVAKSTTITETRPISYSFPAPAAAVAKTHTTVTETKPIPYAFPAAPIVPVAKSQTTTITQAEPIAYSFPEPAAVPVAKTIAQAPVAVAAAAPVAYSFPAPAAVPVAKSSSLAYAAAPIAPIAYAAPTSKFSYSTQVINNAPAHYAVKSYHPSAFAYAPRYALNPILNTHSAPFYRPLYSPAVASFAGPVPYFSNIEYHGYPVVKK
ncbi:cuticle protein 14 isoform b [Nephila pilipes]|uniref:Cuticle protein 14 isoform b n=1 Tax=Nephila pilipes TaxID=299642 RepID=A0A8X6NDJ0_NEPPI|nr:cuticle protein 14 isoform b [Nephila pilipes]